jgi:hypothetical protein
MFYKFKVIITKEVGNIVHVTGNKIVHADNKVTLYNQTIAYMGTEESGPSGN